MTFPPWLNSQWQQLVESHKNDRLSHAILLGGAEGVGKFQLGHELRVLALCSEKQVPACGQCRSCRVAAAGNHADSHELFLPADKKNISVDQVRELIENLSLTPSYQNRKVAVVSPAEAMTSAAANALLKTLEEPPGDSLLILISHQTWRLPATIKSRCQMMRCTTPLYAEAASWLQSKYGESHWKICLALAQGAPYKANNYKKQNADAIFESTIEDVVGLHKGRLSVANVAQSWSSDDIAIRLRSLDIIVGFLMRHRFNLEGDVAHKSDFLALRETTQGIKLSELLGYYDQVIKTQARLESTLNGQLMLEDLLSPWVSGFGHAQLEQLYL